METKKEIRQYNIDLKGCLSVEIAEYIEIDDNKVYFPDTTQYLAFTPLQMDLARMSLPENYYLAYKSFCTSEVVGAFKASLPEEFEYSATV